tara:strand:+ start:615 stop:845 length:231 start_codon:yes stop_codon:yes gene_type:complete
MINRKMRTKVQIRVCLDHTVECKHSRHMGTDEARFQARELLEQALEKHLSKYQHNVSEMIIIENDELTNDDYYEDE